MNLNSPIHLLISLKMLSIHFGIKTSEYLNDNHGLKNPFEIAIKTYEQHPSISLIKENITNNEIFVPTEQESILKEIIDLANKKMELLKTFLLVVSGMYQIYVALC